MWSQHSKVFLIFLQKIPFFLQSNSFKLVLILDFKKKICISVLFLLKPTLLDFYFDLYLARLLTVILSYRNVIFQLKKKHKKVLLRKKVSFTIGYCSKKHNLKICVDVRGHSLSSWPLKMKISQQLQGIAYTVGIHSDTVAFYYFFNSPKCFLITGVTFNLPYSTSYWVIL